jgi:NADPH:quinone reductase
MIPVTMQAITLPSFGGPDCLVPAQIETPSFATQSQNGLILIKVAAAGVNRPDILQRTGNYNPPPGASLIPGLEVSGTVVAIDAGVTRWNIGQSVCALVPGGGYAEYCLVHQDNVLPIPDGMTLTEAAGLPETYFTVWTNVFERGGLKSGETLLVHGGTSGIGSTAIQLAKQFGAFVVTTAGSDEKCAACKQLGADIAINYRTQDFVDVLRNQKTAPDVTLCMVGGDYLAKNIQVANKDGRIVQIAFQKGAKIEADFLPLMLKRLTLTGSTLRPRSVLEKASIAQALESQVWPLLSEGKCRPLIHATFPLAKAADAHRMMEAGTHVGKIILVNDGEI